MATKTTSKQKTSMRYICSWDEKYYESGYVKTNVKLSFFTTKIGYPKTIRHKLERMRIGQCTQIEPGHKIIRQK